MLTLQEMFMQRRTVLTLMSESALTDYASLSTASWWRDERSTRMEGAALALSIEDEAS